MKNTYLLTCIICMQLIAMPNPVANNRDTSLADKTNTGKSFSSKYTHSALIALNGKSPHMQKNGVKGNLNE